MQVNWEATVEDYNSAVTVAKVRDFLCFEGARRIYGSPRIDGTGGEDVKTLRPRETLPSQVWFLQKT